MSGRRSNGEGSVYKTADGRWRAAADLGWEDGRRRRKVVTGRTRQEAVRKLREAQRQAEQGVVADDTLTVARWLDEWLSDVVKRSAKSKSPNTHAMYATTVRVHLSPGLGHIKLAKLTVRDVQGFLRLKADTGLSDSYVRRMRTILGAALRVAQAQKLVSENVALLADAPQGRPPVERRPLTADNARALLRAAQGDRLEALVVVGVTAGLRPGELTGLLWSDIDLDGGTLTVSGSMKRTPTGGLVRGTVKRSTAGQRTVALPPIALVALSAHKARAAAERLAAGPLWADHGLVFTSTIGTPCDPSNVRRAFAAVAKRAGVDAGFLYLLRHTAVTLLVDAGVSIEEVADMLGDHPQTLYRHYRHRGRPVAQAATRMEQVLTADG